MEKYSLHMAKIMKFKISHNGGFLCLVCQMCQIFDIWHLEHLLWMLSLTLTIIVFLFNYCHSFFFSLSNWAHTKFFLPVNRSSLLACPSSRSSKNFSQSVLKKDKLHNLIKGENVETETQRSKRQPKHTRSN